MFAVGDIIQIFSPIAGYNKYHLCISVGTDGAASKFLFLNSDPSFQGTYAIKCDKVPCIPASDTGFTAFSFNLLVRYNNHQLGIFKAQKLGELDKGLAADLLAFVLDKNNPMALTRPERDIVAAALKAIAGA